VDAQLTGRQLAESQGWHPSKVSKVEAGKQTPSQADVQSWAAACGRQDFAAELAASLHSLEGQYVEFRRLFRAGQRAAQEAIAESEAAAISTLNFESVLVPGLLQTQEYARGVLSERLEDIACIDDVDDTLAARMQRQQVLYRTGKRFHFVVTEAVLRYRFSSREVMAGQLDRLVALTTLPTIRFGVIPFDGQLPVFPLHGFFIYDQQAVHVENFTAALRLTQPAEVEAYAKIFGQLAAAGQYGVEARALIMRALADLATAMP